MLLSPAIVIAGNKSTYTISAFKSKKKPENEVHSDDEGRRIPPVPLTCSISNTGISFIGFYDDIITFEIWDITSETCLASFTEESDFLNFLFAQTGDFNLKFETEGYFICGDITID